MKRKAGAKVPAFLCFFHHNRHIVNSSAIVYYVPIVVNFKN